METEDLRKEVLSELLACVDESEDEIRDRFKPGTFGCHEALHMAAAISRMINLELLEHPAIAFNAEWFAKVNTASSAIDDLYQAIGAVHGESC